MEITPICLQVTLEEIRAHIEEGGVDCLGCGDDTTIIDLSNIILKDGMSVVGTYPFSVKCPGSQVKVGSVSLIDGCKAAVEDFELCERTVILGQFENMVKDSAEARCTGYDQDIYLDISCVTVLDGFVAGGSYTGTYRDINECDSSNTGYINMKRCDSYGTGKIVVENGFNDNASIAEVEEKVESRDECTDCDSDQNLNVSKIEAEMNETKQMIGLQILESGKDGLRICAVRAQSTRTPPERV